jgi:GNAT superfamily N-acetyltransferase
MRAPVEIVPFEEAHLPGAAGLAASHVAAFRQRVPLVPKRWTAPEAYADRLARLVRAGPATVALVDGAMVGFLAAMRIDGPRGRYVFSPEWANVCAGPLARPAREGLYAALAEQWLGDGWPTHAVSVLASDTLAQESLAWLGFGVTTFDGLRGVEPVGPVPRLRIVRAGPSDLDAVSVLEQGLLEHLAATPLFLRYPQLDPVRQRAMLGDAAIATLLATDERGPLAFLRIGPASHDAATIIRDEGTASITGAFTRADRRREGVARALLDAALAWARSEGYVRCAVDFESANLLAARFWPRRFEVVAITLSRRL